MSMAVIITTGASKRYAVDISRKECSYGFHQEELIPCRHTIKFLTSIRREPKDYCSDIHIGMLLKKGMCWAGEGGISVEIMSIATPS